jgi:hypothetical protein
MTLLPVVTDRRRPKATGDGQQPANSVEKVGF